MSIDLLRRAARPTRRRLHEVIQRVPELIRPYLERIAERFLDPAYNMTRIRREAGATDWHGKIFRTELGFSPDELRRALRLEVAIWLMRETSLSLEKIARLVGYDSLRSLESLFKKTCQFAPSKGRPHLRRVSEEYRALGDELRGWYFWVRFHRGELTGDDFVRAAAYLERRFGPV